eukprot:SAG31_NODE_45033_length_260_cov_0.950311_1_plen_43_part_01
MSRALWTSAYKRARHNALGHDSGDPDSFGRHTALTYINMAATT